jgi:hypothetical protein
MASCIFVSTASQGRRIDEYKQLVGCFQLSFEPLGINLQSVLMFLVGFDDFLCQFMDAAYSLWPVHGRALSADT